MRENNTDLDGAMRWVAEYHAKMEESFMEAKASFPRWGEDTDKQVAQYVDGLGNWVRANDSWSFESARYFGEQGLKIQASRLVTLLPKSISRM